MKLSISDTSGKSLGEFELSDSLLVFDKGRQPLKDYVVAYRAHQRAGSASTLTKGEVAGSNKKPWKQKGTGRARAGYRQSPVWRGGGVAFGPKPRAYQPRVNKKAGRLAFRRAFSEKVAAGQVQLLDHWVLAEPKTKEVAGVLKSLKITGKALVLVDAVAQNLALASRNLAGVKVTTPGNVNAYDLLAYPQMVITRAAMAALETRLSATKGAKP